MKRMNIQEHLSQRRRGAAIVLTVVTLVVLLGFASLTVDVGVVYNTRAELQNAADASALAGAGALALGPAAVRARAKEISGEQQGLAHLDVRDEDIHLGQWDLETGQFNVLTGGAEAGANAVRVITRMTQTRGNPVQLYFASIFGKQTIDVAASATACFASARPWHVAITQDVTASFGGDIAKARQADQDLLDCLYARVPVNSNVGLVTFTGYGQVISPMKAIGDYYSEMSAAIATIDQCDNGAMPPCSGTNIGAGLDAAVGILQDMGWDPEFPPSIVLVSDGQPNSSLPGYTTADLEQWAIQSANTAGSLGLSIYTVFYSDGGGNAGEAFLAGLVRGDGKAFSTPDPEEIDTLLELVCRAGLRLMLVE